MMLLKEKITSIESESIQNAHNKIGEQIKQIILETDLLSNQEKYDYLCTVDNIVENKIEAAIFVREMRGK